MTGASSQAPSGEDLIGLLEAAAKGSYALDWKIAGCPGWTDGDANYNVPRYTTSLDAALTLVPDPEYFIWRLEGRKAQLWRNDPRPAIFVDGFAATPPLALCIAALKARAASSSTEMSFDPNSSEGSRTTEEEI